MLTWFLGLLMRDFTPALRRYILVTCLSMGFYVLLSMAAIAGALDGMSRAPRLGFAALVCLTIVIQIWATLIAMRDSDEFIRALMARRFIIAAGAAFAIMSAWGFAESYASAPHIAGWIVYPLFWALYGLVTPFVRNSI